MRSRNWFTSSIFMMHDISLLFIHTRIYIYIFLEVYHPHTIHFSFLSSELKEMLSNHLYMIVSILKSTCWFLSLTRGINTSNLFSELVNHSIQALASPLWTVSNPKIYLYIRKQSLSMWILINLYLELLNWIQTLLIFSMWKPHYARTGLINCNL